MEDAERNLSNTNVTAPIAGVATQVDQIELGRVAPAGQPVFAIVADTGLWVDGNPKESDLTYVRRGLPASVTIDTFPGREWRGRISSIAPGTGAQFAILPPQNASGNWVKVVQRVPLRFCFDPDEDIAGLRAGMSANSRSTPGASARWSACGRLATGRVLVRASAGAARAMSAPQADDESRRSSARC